MLIWSPSPAMSAVADLLVFAEQHSIGVTFLPDDEGWSVGYKGRW